MRTRKFAVLFSLAVCAACASPRRREEITSAPNRNEISVVVFNGRRAEVPFTVIVGDSVLLDTIAPLSRMIPPIAMSAAVILRPGTYRVLVIDGARARMYETKLRIPSDRARIEIGFYVHESDLRVVYGEHVYQ